MSLIDAAVNSDIQVVHSLLEGGVNPNEEEVDGFTTLSRAIWFDKVHIARLLIEKCADPRANGRGGNNIRSGSWKTCHVYDVL